MGHGVGDVVGGVSAQATSGTMRLARSRATRHAVETASRMLRPRGCVTDDGARRRLGQYDVPRSLLFDTTDGVCVEATGAVEHRRGKRDALSVTAPAEFVGGVANCANRHPHWP